MARRLAACAVALGALAPAAGASTGTLVDYRGSIVVPNGGYRMTIAADGAATVRTGLGPGNRAPRPVTRSFQLTAAQLTGLERLLAATRFPGLARHYRFHPAPGCRPGAVVAHGALCAPLLGVGPRSVSYRGKTVTVGPSAAVPARLGRLLAQLASTFERHKPASTREGQP